MILPLRTGQKAFGVDGFTVINLVEKMMKFPITLPLKQDKKTFEIQHIFLALRI